MILDDNLIIYRSSLVIKGSERRIIGGNPFSPLPPGPTGFGSWNCSRSDGPFGPPCVVPRPEGHELPCYDTCPQCDPVNTCDWSACLDDVVFVRDRPFLELGGFVVMDNRKLV